MEPEAPLGHRKHAARLANRAREEGHGDGWFEPMYQWAAGQTSQVPWADGEPHALLVEATQNRQLATVAVVGCGLGDDAEFLAQRAESVWAFDLSPTAIEWAKQRFPNSKVDYAVANLFELPPTTFDFVAEVYTLQALPPEIRPKAIRAIINLLKPGGELVIVTRWRTPEMELGAVPWPLLESELALFEHAGLTLESEHPSQPGEPTRRTYRKPN
jgi:SAM-dependent methyltransferase